MTFSVTESYRIIARIHNSDRAIHRWYIFAIVTCAGKTIHFNKLTTKITVFFHPKNAISGYKGWNLLHIIDDRCRSKIRWVMAP